MPTPESAPDRLRPGRHNLPREVVDGVRRHRVLAAASSLVGRREQGGVP
ncbi:MAG: hypothetical protein ABI251_02185 [Mycobacteriaceae bacterium]